ncbi:hypothetical protein PV703_20075 [Streptomyces sp. ME01-24h]|nr:hypothetical protein [Streptomyces sp. ME19-03-3]MDX3214638.1 hypothetical protein [Streptomyces sp. ME02-6991-2B]MDX3355565.1 hypothetical protein [Streptomyces sp. ME01-24h]
MASHRPPAFVAITAAAVLGALYFVPSASASAEHPADISALSSASTATTTGSDTGQGQHLADTGSVETTPYLVGGTAFLALGAALVVNAGRRARGGAY